MNVLTDSHHFLCSGFVSAGGRDHSPEQNLIITGQTFEEQLLSVVNTVITPAGFYVEKFGRLPYLCEGDLEHSFYKLDDVIFLLRPSWAVNKLTLPTSIQCYIYPQWASVGKEYFTCWISMIVCMIAAYMYSTEVPVCYLMDIHFHFHTCCILHWKWSSAHASEVSLYALWDVLWYKECALMMLLVPVNTSLWKAMYISNCNVCNMEVCEQLKYLMIQLTILISLKLLVLL